MTEKIIYIKIDDCIETTKENLTSTKCYKLSEKVISDIEEKYNKEADYLVVINDYYEDKDDKENNIITKDESLYLLTSEEFSRNRPLIGLSPILYNHKTNFNNKVYML